MKIARTNGGWHLTHRSLFLCLVRGLVGLGVGRWYLLLQDASRYRLLFSQRNQIGYRRLLRLGRWQLGIRRDRGR